MTSYAEGQLYLDGTKVLYICTAGGSPGTWASPYTRQPMTARTATFTAAPWEVSRCNGYITGTLPSSPQNGQRQKFICASGGLTITATGTTIYWASTHTSIGIAAGMSVEIEYQTSVWYVTGTNGVVPSITAYPSAVATIHNTMTTVVLNTTTNVRGGITVVSNAIVIPIAGLYLVTAQALWTTIRSSTLAKTIVMTVTGVSACYASPNIFSVCRIAEVAYYAAGATITQQVMQNVSGTETLGHGPATTYLQVQWKGP